MLVAAPLLPGQIPPPPLPPPPAPEKRTGRRALRAIGYVAGSALGFAAVLVGVHAFEIATRGDTGDERAEDKAEGSEAYPSEWDARATGFVEFVERTTGHEYDHPVHIRFLPAHEFEELVAADAESLDEETKMAVADFEAQARALGLWSGGTDEVDEQDEPSGVLAFYDFEDPEVVVRLPEGIEDVDLKTAEDLPFEVQSTMVHELTHVLQDQTYNLDILTQAAITDEEHSALLGLVEGHAEYIAGRYEAEAVTEEQPDEDDEEAAESSGEQEEESADFNTLLAVSRYSPYVLGPPFVVAIHDSPNGHTVDAAFADPPTTERELMHPAIYLTQSDAPAVETTELPDGAEMLDDDTLGSVSLFLMLTLGLAPNEALEAVDGAAADAYLAYRLDDRVCIDIAVAAVDSESAGRLEIGLEAWVTLRPAEAEASMQRSGDTVSIHTCDPGVDIHQMLPGTEAIDQFFGRSILLDFLVQLGWPLEQATCVADGIFHEVAAGELYESPEKYEDYYTWFGTSCF